MNISPGAFIDISIDELNSKKKTIITDNLSVFKRLGRISNVTTTKFEKRGIKIIVKGESITLYFDQNLDLNVQKEKISKKINELEQKSKGMEVKLQNKSFLQNAPKSIVENEKKSLINNKIELKKLYTILNSIKN